VDDQNRWLNSLIEVTQAPLSTARHASLAWTPIGGPGLIPFRLPATSQIDCVRWGNKILWTATKCATIPVFANEPCAGFSRLAPSKMDHPSFTVVICTKDRRDSLARCLESLAGELRNADSKFWSVLVVDNASSDGTSELVRSISSDFPVELRVIREEQPGVAFARNTGLRQAKGGIVVFADDDVTFHQDWASAWGDVFTAPEVDGGGGPILPVFPAPVPDWFRAGLFSEGGGTIGHYDCGDQKMALKLGTEFAFPATGNAAVRRSTALALGGFREDLGWGKDKKIPGEDTELFSRIHSTGGKIIYTPAPKVDHHLTEQMVKIEYFRQWHEGYGQASTLMKPGYSPLHWTLKCIEQLANLLYYSILLVLPRGDRNFRAHRKQSQAKGRLTQLGRRCLLTLKGLITSNVSIALIIGLSPMSFPIHTQAQSSQSTTSAEDLPGCYGPESAAVDTLPRYRRGSGLT
jgi:GT2 family glycosyltransferase